MFDFIFKEFIKFLFGLLFGTLRWAIHWTLTGQREPVRAIYHWPVEHPRYWGLTWLVIGSTLAALIYFINR